MKLVNHHSCERREQVIFDDFDAQIQSEELNAHNPYETCSTCGERVINCTCVGIEEPDNCLLCHMHWSECQCDDGESYYGNWEGSEGEREE
jgi:hypothetical protein